MLKSVGPLRGTPRASASRLGAQLLKSGLINQHDLSIAEDHAARERIELVDAVVTTGMVEEQDAYGALAAAAGSDLVPLWTHEFNELAIRLLPERIARKHELVPLEVNDRTLTFATCGPLNPEAERDVAFASGHRTRMLVASRSELIAALDRRRLKVVAAA